MSQEAAHPSADTLIVPFVPSAWRRDTRGFGGLVVVVAIYYVWKWVRADEVARGYSDFWGLDPPQLPEWYWLSYPLLILVAFVVWFAVLRLRRDPQLRIGDTEIETAFTKSYTRRVDRGRVTEVRFDPRRKTVRFEIPDGLVLIVDASLLDLSSVGEDAESFAGLCARTLDVPFIRV